MIHAMLAGVCLYAVVHHFWIGIHKPRQPVHLWFSLLSLAVSLYVLAKHGAYAADAIAELVTMRHLGSELRCASSSFAAMTAAGRSPSQLRWACFCCPCCSSRW